MGFVNFTPKLFSAKCHECKTVKRDGHGKSRNGHEKVVGKYFVKSVGTLVMILIVFSLFTDFSYLTFHSC